MIRRFTLTILLWSAFAISNAQSIDELKNSSPEERAARQTGWMKTELTLDSVMEIDVHTINLKYAKANQSIFDSGERKMVKMNKIKANRAAKDKELQNILSKEQYDKYLLKKEAMRQNNRGQLK